MFKTYHRSTQAALNHIKYYRFITKFVPTPSSTPSVSDPLVSEGSHTYYDNLTDEEEAKLETLENVLDNNDDGKHGDNEDDVLTGSDNDVLTGLHIDVLTGLDDDDKLWVTSSDPTLWLENATGRRVRVNIDKKGEDFTLFGKPCEPTSNPLFKPSFDIFDTKDTHDSDTEGEHLISGICDASYKDNSYVYIYYLIFLFFCFCSCFTFMVCCM